MHEDQIIRLFENQWHKIDKTQKKNIDRIYSNDGGISAFECVLFYLHILSTRPRHIIEFSPNRGYSTVAIASAQKVMRNRFGFGTFEINKKACEQTRRAISAQKLDEYCHVIHGDAIKEVPAYIKRRGCFVDFCFIDSDHTDKFAQNYIKKIFPLLSPGCLVVIHDIAAKKIGSKDFKSSLLKGHYKSGEENPVKEFVKNRDYTILHSITGGKHEGANLPTNNKFYDKIKEITQIDFIKSPNKVCPKTLLFKL